MWEASKVARNNTPQEGVITYLTPEQESEVISELESAKKGKLTKAEIEEKVGKFRNQTLTVLRSIKNASKLTDIEDVVNLVMLIRKVDAIKSKQKTVSIEQSESTAALKALESALKNENITGQAYDHVVLVFENLGIL